MTSMNGHAAQKVTLRREWVDLALRLQSMAERTEGPAVLRMAVLLNRAGTPVVWTKPEVVKVEPRFDALETMAGIANELCKEG